GGKSAVLSFIYPNTYKKNLYNKFFDLYDPKIHDHVMLEDLDHDAVDKLSTNFIKTLCDESGFPIDQKYKTPQLARSTILVTSNFTLQEVIMQSEESNIFGKEGNYAALLRRFWHLHIKDFLRVLGLKLLPKYEIQMLKKQGNTDPSKLFYSYDYNLDMPTCTPLQQPEYYQQLIKDSFYK
ncbi:MAG: Phytophthora parasitica virus, partial [Actinomycetota bacterium]